MRFRGFRELVGSDVKSFIQKDLASCFKDLFTGLKRLNFEDNFESFTADVNIQAGETVTIENKLSSPVSKFLTVRQKGNGLLTDGDVWTSERVSVKNNGAVTVSATIIFMR